MQPQALPRPHICCKKREDLMVSTPQAAGKADDDARWRRGCGCLRTSEKLKKILNSFPSPPPPSPVFTFPDPFSKPPLNDACELTCGKRIINTKLSSMCTVHSAKQLPQVYSSPALFLDQMPVPYCYMKRSSRTWQMVSELMQLVQLSVTATALALYYLIYCYMQLVYYTLKSAMYFHHADGPMKITIGVVTLTSILVGFNLVLRMERLFGIFY